MATGIILRGMSKLKTNGENRKKALVPTETATFRQLLSALKIIIIRKGGIKMLKIFKIYILKIKHLMVSQGVSPDTPYFSTFAL